ncbi:hypothetical protein [Aquilutibacter rugosus]|uniref:hypothetical protein n=1 Tax=Aquilutibacter rugosus TaxID=3115820 RepID=UPI002F409B65
MIGETFSSKVVGIKVLTALVAAEGAIKVAESVTRSADPMMIHGLLSVPLFYASLIGAAIGVFIKHRQVASDLGIPSGSTALGRALSVLLKIGGFGAVVLGFAAATTGLLQIPMDYGSAGDAIKTTPGWAGAAILFGISIGALLPKIQSGLESWVDSAVRRGEDIIGGKRE